LEKYSQPPYSVSRDFGQLAASRHFTSGIDCAIAGDATALAARPTPPAFKKSRRFIRFLLRFVSIHRREGAILNVALLMDIADGQR
jgi:hypothetical protein